MSYFTSQDHEWDEPADEHAHECRDCGASILCRTSDEACDWQGGSDGCEDCTAKLSNSINSADPRHEGL